MSDALRNAALDYARRGWPVFPVQAPKHGDLESGKKPLTPHGFKDATTNLNVVERWWDRWPEAGIGVPTGEAIGAWVLDVDGAEGSASLTALEQELGALPETLESHTGGGGRHFFFAWPAGRSVGNRQHANKRAGIDVRGAGGYVVVPPSGHASGRAYDWPLGPAGKIAAAPKAWLDFVAPVPRSIAPWERPVGAPPPAPRSVARAITRTATTDRARLYLRECDPSVQGAGGHNALLWAARALVVGFELDDATAIELLWSEFNPRCQPPWDRDDERQQRDFERKVSQARVTPGEKPTGWLLDELGLRSSAESLTRIAKGGEIAARLLASAASRAVNTPERIEFPPEPDLTGPLPPAPARGTFPVDALPPAVEEYVRALAGSHCVDLSTCGLPALAVAGAAMGNAWRLQLKRGFVVPPLLWVALVGPSGSNKSGPLREVVAPLRRDLTVDRVSDPMLNPQGQAVVSDATLEAVVVRMRDSARGLLVFRDELAGWAKSFNAYRKGGGGDEQAWLEFWGGGDYRVDRKTQDERIHIPAASAAILGGIQPKVLVECFDPKKFASGLVPRILIACPPVSDMFWREDEVDPAAEAAWHAAITWLRATPFVGLDANAGRYLPRVLSLSVEAKAAYVGFFNAMELEIGQTPDENARAFMSKARVQAGRLALIHHGLRLAGEDRDLARDVGLASMESGIRLARWCLEEQLRVYGFGAKAHREQAAAELASKIRERFPDGATAREIQRTNWRRYENVGAAKAALVQLVELGHARWADEAKSKVLLVEQGKKA